MSFFLQYLGQKEFPPRHLADDCGVTDVEDLEALWQCTDEWRALGKPLLPAHKAKIALTFQRRQEVRFYLVICASNNLA